MRFMMIMLPKGYEQAKPGTMPDPKAVEAMMKYNEALQKAGVLLALDGLHPPSMGARVSLTFRRMCAHGRSQTPGHRSAAAPDPVGGETSRVGIRAAVYRVSSAGAAAGLDIVDVLRHEPSLQSYHSLFRDAGSRDPITVA